MTFRRWYSRVGVGGGVGRNLRIYRLPESVCNRGLRGEVLKGRPSPVNGAGIWVLRFPQPLRVGLWKRRDSSGFHPTSRPALHLL